ncbi:MAG: hypothetical protein KF773_16880 [Deltaproteobacteria bacterium]|nr:hypothetical protein [Deltaproteobacteria bacterium]
MLKLLGVVALVVALTSSVTAGPSVTVHARMFLRHTGALDDDLLNGATNTSKPVRVGNLDYGVRGRELLIDVAVPDGVGNQLTVTVKQGKLNATQTWEVTVGRSFGITIAHHPMLVSPIVCGGPMTISAKVGAVTETRTINFACSE